MTTKLVKIVRTGETGDIKKGFNTLLLYKEVHVKPF